MLCKECGTEVSNDSFFCYACGVKINTDDNREEVTESSKEMERINQMIANLGQLSTFGTRKEINFLPEVLHADEEIKYLISGFLYGNTWLIVCTNKRVIFLDKGMLFGLKQKEIPLEKINSITQTQGLMLGQIGIWDGASNITIQNVPKKNIKPFVDALNKSIEELKNKPQAITLDNKIDSNPIEKIKKLAELKESGIISEEEFQAQKSKLLELI